MRRWGYTLALAASIAIILAGIGSCLHPSPLAWPGYRGIAAETSPIQREPFEPASVRSRPRSTTPMTDVHPALAAASLLTPHRGAALRFGVGVVWAIGLVTLLLLLVLTRELETWTRSNRR